MDLPHLIFLVVMVDVDNEVLWSFELLAVLLYLLLLKVFESFPLLLRYWIKAKRERISTTTQGKMNREDDQCG